jgi:hypothetical protein
MSTVPEVLAAKEEGMEVCVLSLVTNAVVIPDGYWSIREEVEAEVGRLFYCGMDLTSTPWLACREAD